MTERAPSKLVGPIIAHPVPQTGEIGWAYVFGSATLFSFITLVATGIVLATAYIPATGDAYNSLQFISNDTFGRILRGIHYFSASAMMIMHRHAHDPRLPDGLV